MRRYWPIERAEEELEDIENLLGDTDDETEETEVKVEDILDPLDLRNTMAARIYGLTTTMTDNGVADYAIGDVSSLMNAKTTWEFLDDKTGEVTVHTGTLEDLMDAEAVQVMKATPMIVEDTEKDRVLQLRTPEQRNIISYISRNLNNN